jgi:predicted transcriptional regulator
MELTDIRKKLDEADTIADEASSDLRYEVADAIVEALEEGQTQKEVAEALERNQSFVSRYAKVSRQELHATGLIFSDAYAVATMTTDKQDEAITAAREAGCSIQALFSRRKREAAKLAKALKEENDRKAREAVEKAAKIAAANPQPTQAAVITPVVPDTNSTCVNSQVPSRQGFVRDANDRLREGIVLMHMLSEDTHTLIAEDIIETERLIAEIKANLKVQV